MSEPTAASTSPRILLRLANDADRPFARDLTRANMAVHHQTAGQGWDDELFDQYWKLTFNSLVLVEEAQQQHVAGLVRLHLGEATAILWDLQLLPRFRGQGIGSQLMVRVLDTCREKGITSISLDVYKTNPAMHLYRRFGFNVELETPHALKMSRSLP